MRYRSALSSALVIAFVASPVDAGEVHYVVSGSDLARRALAAACTQEKSDLCRDALAAAVPQAAQAIVRLAERRHPRAADLARRAADSAAPELRVAAATAFGQLSVEASFTPLLGELLDDPVPAVRAAALVALRSSMDEAGRMLVQRADRFGMSTAAAGLEAETVPATSGLGVALPADALFLAFASDARAGRYAYVTAESVASLVARLKRAGTGPHAPEQWSDMLLALETPAEEDESQGDDGSESGMPSAADLAKAMEMMAKMNQAMNEHPEATTPEQQARVMDKAWSGRRHVDASLGDLYGDAALFGDPKLFLVELSDGRDIAVAVYVDKVLGRTGIAVHSEP